MLERGTAHDRNSSVAVSRIRHAKPEEGLNQPPGELVPADKVEEILHGLDLPATGETEENLAASPDEYDRSHRGGRGAGRGECQPRGSRPPLSP